MRIRKLFHSTTCVFLCKIEEDRLRVNLFKHLSKGKKNIAKIQCYEHYRKDRAKFKGNNKKNREEVYFTEEVEESERRKSKEQEKH